MQNNKIRKFEELSKVNVQGRTIVISKNNIAGGFTLGQQVTITEGNFKSPLFLKGAIHLGNEDDLYNMRDAINEAIDKLEANNNK